MVFRRLKEQDVSTSIFNGHTLMSEDLADFLPLRVTKISADGKRSFDKRGKQRLIEAYLRPGVSIAGMALKAGVNANQLWRWISRHKNRHAGGTGVADAARIPAATFVPVVEVMEAVPMVVRQRREKPKALPTPADRETVHASQRSPLPSRLVAQLPNGVNVELECATQDCALVTAMIETLARCDVPARR
jgi:transposase